MGLSKLVHEALTPTTRGLLHLLHSWTRKKDYKIKQFSKKQKKYKNKCKYFVFNAEYRKVSSLYWWHQNIRRNLTFYFLASVTVSLTISYKYRNANMHIVARWLVATQPITHECHCFFGFRALSSVPHLPPFTGIKWRRDREEASVELVHVARLEWRPFVKKIQSMLIFTIHFILYIFMWSHVKMLKK